MRLFLQRIYIILSTVLLGIALPSCLKDKGSYEAEIKAFCFVKQVADDTTVRLSTDTIHPQSTEVQVRVVSGTNLEKLVPWFTLSPGAKADKELGREYDARKGFSMTVTSENGRVARTYRFSIAVEESLGPDAGRGVDSVFRNGDAYIENVRIKGMETIIPRQLGKRIFFEVPEGTDITRLAPTFDLAKGATSEFISGSEYDFSDPLYVRVTSEDKRVSVGYIIYVKVAGPPPCSEARIWDFRFDETLAKSVMQGASIYCAVEAGLDIASLTPRYERSDGTTVDIPSGKPHDFSKPVKITVRSQDGSAKSVYTVVVERVKSSEANLLDFSIKEVRGGHPTYSDDRSICFYLNENALDLKSITPLFTVSAGASLATDAGEKITSGVPCDLSSAKGLVVTSEDGASQRVYSLQIVQGKDNATGWTPNRKIHSFDFLSPQCVVPPVIMEGRIMCVVPHGTDLKHLIPEFSLGEGIATKKPKVYVEGTDVEVVSGVTELDFSQPVSLYVYYFIKGYVYSVEVREAQPKMLVGGLKSFSLLYDGGEVRGSIGNGKVYALLPPGINIKALTPKYEVTKGYKCSLGEGVARDFSSPVSFTVSSPDGALSRGYEVVVRQGKNSEADMFDFRIEGLPSPKIYGNDITFYGVPESVDITSLTPRFSLSRGATANIVPGVPHSFKDPVKITVVSEDGSMRQVYTVRVEQQLNSEAELLSFRFQEFGGELKIVGGTLSFDPPAVVDPKRLTPIFTVSTGATANHKSGVPADFSRPVRLTITSQDESMMRTYTISRGSANQGLKFDFETWKTIGSGRLAYEHPTGPWSSGNEGVKTSMQMLKRPERYPLRKTTDAHSGSYAAEIVTELVNNTLMVRVRIAAGSLFMGSFNASNIMADPLSGPQFGLPYSGALPDRLQGWYKYQPGDDNLDNYGNPLGKTDECDIYAILYTGDVITAKDVKNNPRIVAIARLKDRGEKSQWTHFDEPFEYVREPDPQERLKFSIIMTSSVQGDVYSGAVGSRLVVDDVEVVLR